MSPVESCTGCSRLFPFLPRGLCADCIDLRESRYHAVREWLLDNRGASVLAASEATGVEERLIMEFIREGRFEFIGAASVPAPEDEDLKERIRRDLAARGPAAGGTLGGPGAARPPVAPRGMRSRGS